MSQRPDGCHSRGCLTLSAFGGAGYARRLGDANIAEETAQSSPGHRLIGGHWGASRRL